MHYLWDMAVWQIIAAAAAMIIGGLTAWTASTVHARRHPPVAPTALEVFLAEDVYELTVRETSINPATVDTELAAFDWPANR